MSKIGKLVLGVLIFVGSSLLGQKVKYSNEFLAIGVGSRALGMAGANVASVNDVYAGYWNPAGLLQIKNQAEFGLMHCDYFAGLAKYDFGAVALRLDSSNAIGLSMVRFGVDNIPNTLSLIDQNGNVDYDKITRFSVTDFAALISYAKKLKIQGLGIGGSVKIIRIKLGEFGGAWGFGMDLGMQYLKNNWRFAVSGRDVSGTFNAYTYTLTDEMKETFDKTGNEIPKNSLEITRPRLIFGLGRMCYVWKKNISIYPEVNFISTFDGKRNTVVKTDFMSVEPNAGLELGFKDFLFLRGGLGNVQQMLDFNGVRQTTMMANFGVGLRIKKIHLDYAFSDIGDKSIGLYSHVFSLKFKLDGAKKSPIVSAVAPETK